MAKFPGQSEVIAAIKAATVVHFQIDYSDATGTFTIPVPAGTFVQGGATVVTTVFDGTPNLTIGDGDSATGYGDNTDIALGTAATGGTPAVKLFLNSGNAFANGKYYPSDDTIDFAWTKGTSPTTGVLKGWVKMSNVKNDGLAAGAAS